MIEETLKCIREKEYWNGEEYVDLSEGIEEMEEGSVMLSSLPSLDSSQCPHISFRNVTVENKDTYEKASEEGWQEEAICLNMASEFVPGGGVLRGSKAQEEDLCRRSTLLYSLYLFADEKYKTLLDIKKGKSGSYPLHTYGAIYSPSVEVFRDRESAFLSQPFSTNVISMAALRNPDLKPNGDMFSRDKEIAKEKIRSLFRAAGLKKKRKLVLGAWGCGAFHNPPKTIAKLFRSVMKEDEFKGWFSDICFAILDNPTRKENNYKIFKDEIQGN